jgi:hypothetical protein
VEVEVECGSSSLDVSPISTPPVRTIRSLRRLPESPLSGLDDEDEDLHQMKTEAADTRQLRSDIHAKMEQEVRGETSVVVLAVEEHEFLGLVEEVPLEKAKKQRSQGKARKRLPKVDFSTAADVVRLPRINASFFGEGAFTERLPEQLEGIVS